MSLHKSRELLKFIAYMLGAKHGFVQSMDCAAQRVDPRFAQMIHGSRFVCAILVLHHLCVGSWFRSRDFLHMNCCFVMSIIVGRASFDDFIQQNFIEMTKDGRGATLS